MTHASKHVGLYNVLSLKVYFNGLCNLYVCVIVGFMCVLTHLQ